MNFGFRWMIQGWFLKSLPQLITNSPIPKPKHEALLRQRQLAASWVATVFSRSEEHTSELQSHLNLVCRLLLEKKKTVRNLLVLSAMEHEIANKRTSVKMVHNC